jgi:hypothetical protein
MGSDGDLDDAQASLSPFGTGQKTVEAHAAAILACSNMTTLASGRSWRRLKIDHPVFRSRPHRTEQAVDASRRDAEGMDFDASLADAAPLSANR